MKKWKAEINGKEEEFVDIRDKKIFLKREFVPVIVEFVKQNENYTMEENSMGKVVSPEGEDVSKFAHYAIFYRKKDGTEVKFLFALLEDESSHLVGVSNEGNEIEMIEEMFNVEEIATFDLFY